MRQIRVPIARKFRGAGQDYGVTLLGRCRSDGIWEARLRFRPIAGGGVMLTTPVESTQPNERDLISWAEGQGNAFYEGAFSRAVASVERKSQRRVPKSPTTRVDPAEVQKRVLDCFRIYGASTLNRQVFFDCIDDLSNADILRAIEALERTRQVVRFTDRGAVWIALSKSAKPRVRNRAKGVAPPQLIDEHPHPIRVRNRQYDAAILGVQRRDGTWAGWIQFRDVDTGRKLRTGQETSQPNRRTLEYWASGLEDLYFEGALQRAEPVKEPSPKRSRVSGQK